MPGRLLPDPSSSNTTNGGQSNGDNSGLNTGPPSTANSSVQEDRLNWTPLRGRGIGPNGIRYISNATGGHDISLLIDFTDFSTNLRGGWEYYLRLQSDRDMERRTRREWTKSMLEDPVVTNVNNTDEVSTVQETINDVCRIAAMTGMDLASVGDIRTRARERARHYLKRVYDSVIAPNRNSRRNG
ncbi:hypothetical protein L204_102809 [Cryptococcus depauperatus]|nr:hypothetical protein L204_00442 [Cryptococcus depauperatus CBS 7855]